MVNVNVVVFVTIVPRTLKETKVEVWNSLPSTLHDNN